MTYEEFESDVYPKLWEQAYAIGRKAKADGLPKVCNLGDNMRTPSGNVIRCWLSAWERGYNHLPKNDIPEEFKQVEAFVNSLPYTAIS